MAVGKSAIESVQNSLQRSDLENITTYSLFTIYVNIYVKYDETIL